MGADPGRRGVGLGQLHHRLEPLGQGAAQPAASPWHQHAGHARMLELVGEVRGDPARGLELDRARSGFSGQLRQQFIEGFDRLDGAHGSFLQG